MVLTQSEARAAFSHILQNVFGRADGTPLQLELEEEGIEDLFGFAAIDDGSTVAVLFVGTNTQVTNVYGIKTDKQFINTLEDNITNCGAPHKLLSDSAQVLISNKVQYILRTLCIKSWQSEPHQQQQNPAERRYQTIKRAANQFLDHSSALDYTWLLCLQYVYYSLNHAFKDTLKGIPLQLLSGITVDISPLLRIQFWQKNYYKSVDSGFPSDSVEIMVTLLAFPSIVVMYLPTKLSTTKPSKLYIVLSFVQLSLMISTCALSRLVGRIKTSFNLEMTLIMIFQIPSTSTLRHLHQL
jgi:hypothetical protein